MRASGHEQGQGRHDEFEMAVRLMRTAMRSISKLKRVVIAASMGALSVAASAGPNYIAGHISNVTFNGNEVLVMIDSGQPDNCAGASVWLRISPEYKPINAFVLGLWMRGDAAQVNVMVYTAGIAGAYCEITQIDPAG